MWQHLVVKQVLNLINPQLIFDATDNDKHHYVSNFSATNTLDAPYLLVKFS